LESRRNQYFNGFILYLHNHDSLNNHPLSLPTKQQIIKFGIAEMKQLFPEENIDSSDKDPEPSSSLTLQEKLHFSVGSVKKKPNKSNSNSHKNEFSYYERHQILQPNLEKFFESLMTAWPTSVQSERTASIATKK
jgi:hypothetical protein